MQTLDDHDQDSDSGSSSSSYDRTDHNVEAAMALSNDHLLFLFGATPLHVHAPATHPQQVQIFRLWQIYLDNVNPLCKVTHTPTLQPRIIDAASNVTDIAPGLDALMFSIYCVALLSLTDDECRLPFHTPRELLLAEYHMACQQALLRCTPWRPNDHDGLIASYLYLVCVIPTYQVIHSIDCGTSSLFDSK